MVRTSRCILAASRAVAPVVACAFALPACLGPQVSDEIPPAGLVLPAGSEVPSVYDDSELAAQIADNDNVDGVVPRLSAFAGGGAIHYWDFGPAPAAGAALFLLHRPPAGGGFDLDALDLVDHGGIVDALPGEPGYTPFWTVFLVPVTPEYDGEIIPSLAAIEEAQQLGLVGAPEATTVFVNCPIVADDVELDRGGGITSPPAVGFVRGSEVLYFDFTALFGVLHPLVGDGAQVPEAPSLRLAREGGEPLSEPVRGVDMTGDGDIADTADVLDVPAELAQYTPLSRVVEVTVPSGFLSIDGQGEGNSDARAIEDLFVRAGDALEPIVGDVVAFEVTDELRNQPVDLGELIEGGGS